MRVLGLRNQEGPFLVPSSCAPALGVEVMSGRTLRGPYAPSSLDAWETDFPCFRETDYTKPWVLSTETKCVLGYAEKGLQWLMSL